MHHIGLDVGSTTVKIVILDENGKTLHKKYQRHYSDIKKTLAEVLTEGIDKLGEDEATIAVTGSGGINVAKWLDIPFVQEVTAGAVAIEKLIPQTDVAIELGGEDAKLTEDGRHLRRRHRSVYRSNGGTAEYRYNRP